MSVSESQHAMLQSLFGAIDAKDSSAFVDHLTDDASFRFGSAPAAVGRDAIKDAVEGFFGTIAGLSHELSLVLADNDQIVCEGLVTYTRHDGSTIALPFADIFDMAADKIASYKIYMDIAPLYAE